MTSKTTRSTIPFLPPIGNPINPSLRTDHQGPPRLAILSSPPEGSDNHDLEARIGLLEQAHRMLLEEMVNGTANTNSSVGGVNSINHTHLTIAHILKTLTETERQVHSLQTQLDQVTVATQRTRDETYSYQRASWDTMNDNVTELRDKMAGLQKHLLTVQDDVDYQKKAWSGSLATVSSDLIQQMRGGAKSVTELEKSLRNVECNVHNLSDGLSNATASLHSSLTNLTQSRYDELASVLKEMQGRISNIEAHDHQQNTWLKQSFQDIDGRLTKQSSNIMSSIKIVGNHVQQLEHQLETMETNMNSGLHSLREKIKKDRLEIEERLNKDIDEWAELQKATPTLNKLVDEVENFKKTFKDHKTALAKSMSYLTRSLTLIEQESDAMKQDLTQVLKAEIKTRLEEERSINECCTDIITSYSDTTEQLKQSVTQLEEKWNKNNTEFLESVKACETHWKDAHYRLLTDVDARLQASVHNKERKRDSVQERVSDIDHKLKLLHDRLDTLDTSTEGEEASARIRKINATLSETSTKLHDFMTNVQEMQLKLGNQIQSESSKRFQEMIQLRNDLSWITSQLLSSNHQQSFYPTTTNNTRLTAPSVFITQNQPVDGSGRQVGVVTSPTPEPITSPQSSPPVAHKWKKSRKGRGSIRHVIDEPSETMGTFTSLAPTPVEMRKILGNEPSDYLISTTDEVPSNKEEDNDVPPLNNIQQDINEGHDNCGSGSYCSSLGEERRVEDNDAVNDNLGSEVNNPGDPA